MFNLDADTIRQLTEGLATIQDRAGAVQNMLQESKLESHQAFRPVGDVRRQAIKLARLLPDFEKDPADEQPRDLRGFDGKTTAESYIANFCGMPDKGILSNMLAVMHGDGGHYEGEHGTPKAAADALAEFVWLKANRPPSVFRRIGEEALTTGLATVLVPATVDPVSAQFMAMAPDGPIILQPPQLDIDKQLHPNGDMLARCRVERRVVWNLIAHLARAGFMPRKVREDVIRKTPDPKSMMEWIFNLDDCWIEFGKIGARESHAVYIVLGNDGTDCISDWQYTEGDPDGFNKTMDAFDAEFFA